MSPLAKAALYTALAGLVFFVSGLITGTLGSHQPGEDTSDLVSFILCRVVSSALAFASWTLGLAAIMRRPEGPTWSAVAVMLFLLIFIVLLGYSAWRGTAAFHPNVLTQ
ncbi:MAG: hypothetical protein V4662_10665 [Verrucomicrobiota bacterium]